MRISNKEREIVRATIDDVAAELRKKHPKASIEDVRMFLHQMIDVSV